MDLNSLTSGPRKSRKRVGRGPSSGRGKTCGRGQKGQKSRSGYSRKAYFEGGQMPLMRRLPKRGFTHTERHPVAEVNLDILDAGYEAGAEVTPENLVERGLAKKLAGGVKILGRGEITKSLTIRANACSASARSKIEAAGGSVAIVGAPAAKAVTRRSKGKKQQ